MLSHEYKKLNRKTSDSGVEVRYCEKAFGKIGQQPYRLVEDDKFGKENAR